MYGVEFYLRPPTYVSSGQGSSGYWPSSLEYSRIPSALIGQNHEGPRYQTCSPSKCK